MQVKVSLNLGYVLFSHNVVHPLRKDIVLVESYKPKQKYVPPKHWIDGLKSTVLDRDVILSPTGMLNDSLINASQKLLKIQFPSVSGLQDVELGLCMSFKYESGEFVHVTHTTENHWITLSILLA